MVTTGGWPAEVVFFLEIGLLRPRKKTFRVRSSAPCMAPIFQRGLSYCGGGWVVVVVVVLEGGFWLVVVVE
jgi:hypothetical protein